MIQSLGYEVETVENGLEALEYLKNNSADIVILDMIMPVMDGRETFDKIIERKIETKVILTSGFSENQNGPFMN